MPTSPAVPPPGSRRQASTATPSSVLGKFQRRLGTALGLKAMNVFTRAHVAAYRISGGRLGGKGKGAPILLLDHVGRKSGRRRTTPLFYLPDGENLVIVASRGGSDAPPAWLLNLQTNPQVMVQIGAERRAVVARQATPKERERLWPLLVEMFPDYAVYQQHTEREIAVIVLSRA